VAPRASPGIASGDGLTAARRARARGSVIHRLLQSLPDIAPAQRAAQARAYLVRAARGGAIDWSADDTESTVRQVLAMLDDPRFAAVFAPGSRAEVAVAGLLPGIRVNGQIDRLAVTASEVLIVDYKTGRPGAAPPAYVRQLALYRAVLAKLYPDRAVRAALVWTDAPDLVEIPAAALDAALAQTLKAASAQVPSQQVTSA
jgi:ATP-dependent helicase/nuclease subunit A